MTTNDLPTPRFRIGQTVWRPTTTRTVEPLPCPDCLDTKVWKVVTPAGTEMETACQRCATRHFRVADDIPRPERVVFKPSAERLTIGSVRLDTARQRDAHNDPVEYMARETGIGSGSIYRENSLYDTEEAALAAAQAEADAQTVRVSAQPDQLAARKLDNLQIHSAVIKDARDSKWNAWYAYRRLAEETQEALDDEGLTSAEKLEAIDDHLSFDKRHRDLPDIGKALKMLRSLCGDTPEAAEAFKALMLPDAPAEPADWLAAE